MLDRCFQMMSTKMLACDVFSTFAIDSGLITSLNGLQNGSTHDRVFATLQNRFVITGREIE